MQHLQSHCKLGVHLLLLPGKLHTLLLALLREHTWPEVIKVGAAACMTLPMKRSLSSGCSQAH